eukprot:10910970-Alexandrium_andersonii.AAC.1
MPLGCQVQGMQEAVAPHVKDGNAPRHTHARHLIRFDLVGPSISARDIYLKGLAGHGESLDKLGL